MQYQFPAAFAAIDVHNHVRKSDEHGGLDKKRADNLLEGCARLGIEQICVSRPMSTENVTPAEFRSVNDTVWEAMQYSPRFLGFCFVDAHYPEEAQAEIRRCICELGMLGVKLYHQFFVDDDRQLPVMSLAAELGVPVLVHAGRCTDPATRAAQPRLSHAGHFRKALAKFPDTILIQGHIGGGGDWEWNLRLLENLESDNYYLDLSGSVIDAGMVRRCVDTIGCERLLFATDGSLEEGVGKLMAAKLSHHELQLICRGNFERIMARRKKCHV